MTDAKLGLFNAPPAKFWRRNVGWLVWSLKMMLAAFFGIGGRAACVRYVRAVDRVDRWNRFQRERSECTKTARGRQTPS